MSATKVSNPNRVYDVVQQMAFIANTLLEIVHLPLPHQLEVLPRVHSLYDMCFAYERIPQPCVDFWSQANKAAHSDTALGEAVRFAVRVKDALWTLYQRTMPFTWNAALDACRRLRPLDFNLLADRLDQERLRALAAWTEEAAQTCLEQSKSWRKARKARLRHRAAPLRRAAKRLSPMVRCRLRDFARKKLGKRHKLFLKLLCDYDGSISLTEMQSYSGLRPLSAVAASALGRGLNMALSRHNIPWRVGNFDGVFRLSPL